MPYRKQIAEIDLSIENLLVAIDALRAGNASSADMDRALADLARAKAERLRLMLRQVNLRAEREAAAPSGPKDREARAAQLDNPDG